MLTPDRRLAVAPMMNWTDRHCRAFLRMISKHTLLYTEMLTTGAIIHGDTARALQFSRMEKPLALQLGGSDAKALGECAAIASDFDFDEINLNVGCPSDRVQSGRFGACLMAEPELVADCISSMQARTQLPVTVKTRLGIDDYDSYEYLSAFITSVAAAGCRTFILHARKAWLQGLSPKQNREVPPLQYATVHAIKRDFPQLEIIINGGFTTLAEVQTQLQRVDGVMIGRAVYHDPYLLAPVDHAVFHSDSGIRSREEILQDFITYAAAELQRGERLSNLSRHILGLYQGQPGARAYRRHISEHGPQKNAGIEVLQQAMQYTRPSTAASPVK